MAKPKSSSSIRRLRLSGAVFLLTTSLVLLAAWNTGTNLFYLVVGGLASFLIVSVLTVGWGVRGLRISREAPEAVHRGEPVAVRVRIENHKRLLPSLSLRVEGAARRGEAAGYIAKIPPARRSSVSFSSPSPPTSPKPISAPLPRSSGRWKPPTRSSLAPVRSLPISCPSC